MESMVIPRRKNSTGRGLIFGFNARENFEALAGEQMNQFKRRRGKKGNTEIDFYGSKRLNCKHYFRRKFAVSWNLGRPS
jgi:hypothetical protein